MTLPDNIAQIFAALLDAVAKGALGLMVGKDPATGEVRYFIGAIGDENGSPIFAPFGHLTPGMPQQATPDPTLH